MFAHTPLSYWIGFHLLVVMLLAIDLLFLGQKNPEIARRLAWGWTLVLIVIASGFALWLWHVDGRQHALEFSSSYLIESSLSVDNLFVFLLMFRSLALDGAEQRRVLLWGVGGAIIMRAMFIAAGVSLLARFAWVEYLFGVVLLIAAVRLLRQHPASAKPSRLLQWIRRRSTHQDAPLAERADAATNLPVAAEPLSAPGYSAPIKLTPATFLLVVLAVESTDLLFALDSIPAVLAVTRDPFIAYTSNIFAVLGLRSLFFALSGLLERFRLIHYGLAAILAFVAAKMLLTRWVHVNVEISLGVILGILGASIAASLIEDRKRKPAPST